MRTVKFLVVAALLLAATGVLAQANTAPAPQPVAATQAAPASQPMTVDQVIDRIIAREHDVVDNLRKYSPIVETYIQNTRPDPELGSVPIDDHYFLGKVSFKTGIEERLFDEQKGMGRSMKEKVVGPFTHLYTPNYMPSGFANMVFPDAGAFDRQHYTFAFLQREFLGEVRCLVFDVAPTKNAGQGRFQGRIWVEDKDFTVVRVNGTYVPRPKHGVYFHFDTWRVNVEPGVWVPTVIYSEESDALYGFAHHLSIKAQTRLWGYNADLKAKSSDFTEILIDSPTAKDQSPTAQDATPLEGQRAFVQMAEDNVLLRLERAGLLAPSSEVDKVLQTVVNNIEITNKLDITPEIRCRILLTTPMESFSVGHTIVISRGMLDVLPDEASLAAVLARELAHVVLGHRFDTKYAFSDRMIFADERTFRQFAFAHTPEEDALADKKAIELLKNSPYAEKLANAGLFLKALEERAPQLGELTKAHMGSSLVINGHVAHLNELMTAAPQYEPKKLDQIAALPIGGRVKMNSWDDKIEMIKAAPVSFLSAADKMPFQVAPFLPHLKRLGTQGELSASAASK
jgi:Peptidase family M48